MDRIFLEVRNCKGDNLCFIERPRSFIHSSLPLVRGELDAEVGDLLPPEYKFCRRGFPVSRKQEQDLKLNACIRTISPNDEDEDTCDVSCDYCLEIKEFMIKDNMAATLKYHTSTCTNKSLADNRSRDKYHTSHNVE